MWATLIFCGTTTLFLSMTLAALWHLRWVRRLPALEALTTAPGRALSSPSERVRCSVVIAARDEETRIEGTVRRLMHTESPDDSPVGCLQRSPDFVTHSVLLAAQQKAAAFLGQKLHKQQPRISAAFSPICS